MIKRGVFSSPTVIVDLFLFLVLSVFTSGILKFVIGVHFIIMSSDEPFYFYEMFCSISDKI